MTALKAIPFTNAPFQKSEYERRQKNVLEAVARAELDALVVTAHGHLKYLSGYDGMGAYFMPFPLIFVPGRAPTYVVREFELNGVRAESCIDEIVGYTEQPDFARVCADVLRQLGLAGKRIGFELGCWNLAPADVSALQARLPNMNVVDASCLVPSVMAVKSDLEISAMRDAMTMTDVAVRAFQQSLREGITETEMAVAIQSEVRKAGGEDVRLVSIGFGERTKLPHTRLTRHPMGNNEPAMVELGGVKQGYAGALVRGAVLGRHPESERLHALAEEALEAAIAVIKPGVTAGEVDTAARKVIERSGRPQALNHRVGYQTGAPWNERGNISLEPGATEILQANMTVHMPMILLGEDGYMIGCSETVLVTGRGAEVLSRTPHTLYRA
ncbi:MULTISPECIES: Xaa-Pro peptidase family protein [unclassified Bradyrhizobium]|uniref:M24 family metallopeptidase n=1 Tax=unclassified Bradyrhizobium TaxID=2631580 RepID=UPI001CD35A9C|nr:MULTISPECIES: Xaa-Pro peptidase family protein [unclassified Bradyrhizobium]MCA1386365.1 aminopeptidase P family protein [Bradyrhizobium sp. BRP05]MCA1394468.1 aminopeptidase P family protein [Bradyrhizobium sp. IC3123]MCA1423961.1 aminopeptidase P family protein [Bradyrhizobium sp. BRP23]MCA1431157.1 aminopeptidase P family protein [Bradyrhizobium sp. NBAIM16]MCA1480539.1 aminopeptidase P family protein [Bradyrhizobium sp. NBAIM08]